MKKIIGILSICIALCLAGVLLFGEMIFPASSEETMDCLSDAEIEKHSLAFTATVGSYDSEFVKENLNDNDYSTYWMAEKTENWLILDFGEVKDIGKIDVYSQAEDFNSYSFYVSVSNDGSTWTELHGYSTEENYTNDPPLCEIKLQDVTSQYIKLTISADDMMPKICELKVFDSTFGHVFNVTKADLGETFVCEKCNYTYYVPYYTYEIVDGGAVITKADYSLAGDVIIPDTLDGYPVTEIGDKVFSWKTMITSVVIPDSVIKIGEEAFGACHSLTSIKIGSGVKHIGRYAFFECESLPALAIPDSVTDIEVGAFADCISLKNITLGKNVTNITGEAFTSCRILTDITVSEENTALELVDGILYNEDMTELIYCPVTKSGSVEIPDGVLKIGDYAFSACNKLKEIVIPDSVTSIDNSAFIGCAGLTSIVIPDSVTTIEDKAFSSCTDLESVKLGNSVISIGVNAFNYCQSLKTIEIPDSVTTINKCAFYDCGNLKSITVGKGITELGEFVFGLEFDYYLEESVAFDGVTIYGYTGTVIEEYANKYGLKFVSID